MQKFTYQKEKTKSRRFYIPKTEPPLEPAKLPSEAQILPDLVPSHSNLMSSVKNLTLPNSAAFSQPNKFSGNLQEPSVTVLDRAKLAEEVNARFLSFISLFASEEANKSSVKLACACITGLDKVTTTAAAKAAELLKETFFCAEAVGFAAACDYVVIWSERREMNDIVSIFKQSIVGIFLYFLQRGVFCLCGSDQPPTKREKRRKIEEREGRWSSQNERTKISLSLSLSLSLFLSPVADVYSSSSAHNPVTSALFTNSIEPARRMHENRWIYERLFKDNFLVYLAPPKKEARGPTPLYWVRKNLGEKTETTMTTRG